MVEIYLHFGETCHLHLPYPEVGRSKSFKNTGNLVPDYVMSVTSQQTMLFIVPIIRALTITWEICGSDNLQVITLMLVSQKLVHQPIHTHTTACWSHKPSFPFLPTECTLYIWSKSQVFQGILSYKNLQVEPCRVSGRITPANYKYCKFTHLKC